MPEEQWARISKEDQEQATADEDQEEQLGIARARLTEQKRRMAALVDRLETERTWKIFLCCEVIFLCGIILGLLYMPEIKVTAHV